ncbi:MAG: HD-GYP domain-containing protein [Clostridiaceae bacterium]|nr:HD-GYP domain-containing protein [Clostridiaceae bacterium]
MDRKISINVNACLPEMIIAETIYSDYGAVIVWEKTELNQNIINRLKDLDIEIIQVYESSLPHNRKRKEVKPQKKEEANFTESYEKNTDEFKTVLQDLSAGKTSSIEKTHKIVESVYARKDQHREIIDCVTQIRKIDEYTYYHSINVSMLSMLIGKWMKLMPDDIRLLTQAGLLHDVGKCRISPAIINKPDKLDEDEYEEMKKHSEYGYYLVQYIEGMDRKVMETILYHHERYDGSGYPMGLVGEQIPLFARIVGVADTFDAMTANRPYRLKSSPFNVFELMQNGCFGYLDPIVLNAFLLNISYYYIGSKVRLSDGRNAEVVYINRQQYGKPVVKVGEDYLDMSVIKNITIMEML